MELKIGVSSFLVKVYFEIKNGLMRLAFVGKRKSLLKFGDLHLTQERAPCLAIMMNEAK